MAKVTLGNKLYLYRLFSNSIGIGKQASPERLQEVLEADGIWLEDLECATPRELAEACPEFIRVSLYKKGRVLTTIQRNEEWDKLLSDDASDAPAPKAAPKPAKGGKPWKAKKAGTKKGPKPAKPRHKERKPKPAPVAEEAQAEPIADIAAQDTTAVAQTPEPQEGAVAQAPAAPEPQLPVTEQVPADVTAVEATQAPVEVAAASASDAEAAHAKPGQAEPAAPESAVSPAPEPAPVSAPSPLQGLAAQIAAERERLGIVDTLPAVSLADLQAEEVPFETAPQTRRKVGRFASALSHAERSDAPANAPTTAQPQPNDTPAAEAKPTAAPLAEAAPAPAAAPAAPPAAEAQPAVPEPPREPSIHFTIVHDPSAPTADEPQTKDERPLPQMRPADFGPTDEELARPLRPRTAPRSTPTPPRADFPQSFPADVHCSDALLRMLYQVLPVEADVMQVLDEDWRVARSTSTLSGTRAKVTFPLRYLREDGSGPVELTLRRASKPIAGKRWNLAYVDGDDGSGTTHAAAGVEGLPAMDEGAWSDLSGGKRLSEPLSPARELAQFAVLGTWDSFLGTLATMATPERWSFPGEGVGHASRYGILREYITVTFHHVMEQGLLGVDPEHAFAAFNTGLITPFAQDIFACFTEHKGDIPWEFAGFATAGAGELGARLAAELNPLPQAPQYLRSLADVTPERGRLVLLDTEALLSRQLGRLPRAFLTEQLEGNTIAREVLEQELNEAQATGGMDRESVTLLARTIKSDPGLYRRMSRALDDAVNLALTRARVSYRIAAPVYDPADNRTKLLLPLCLVNDAQVDCALVLARQQSGNYQGAAVLSLPRAYACARVVSAEQPSWLRADAVLAR